MDVLIEAMVGKFIDRVGGTHLAEHAEDLGRIAQVVGYAHAEAKQVRKFSGEPYLVHPLEVALLMVEVGGSLALVKAALGHDALADKAMTEEQLLSLIGADAVQLVKEVTEVSRPEDGDRKARKALDREHLAAASEEGQTLCLGDMASNTKDIAERDPKFAGVYLPEKSLILESMAGGNASLRALVQAQIERGQRRLQERLAAAN